MESANFHTGFIFFDKNVTLILREVSSLTTHTADDIKSRYTIWLAHWVGKTNYSGAYGIWQHSEKGSVDGINGNVDLDVGYACCGGRHHR